MISVMLSSFIIFDSMSALVFKSTLGLVEGDCVAWEERSPPVSVDCKAISTDLFSDVPPVVAGVDVGL
jgi:hypothetical protein